VNESVNESATQPRELSFRPAQIPFLKWNSTDDVIAFHDSMPSDRRDVIQSFADAISLTLKSRGEADIVFICTHNSRRSHLGQVWMQALTTYAGWPKTQIRCFSGGTEATACNPRTIASLKRAGFEVASDTSGDAANPVYTVHGHHTELTSTSVCFSKQIAAPGNPTSDFIAVLCCDSASQKCPVVAGAGYRLPVLYEDPKSSDDSPKEAETYDARSRQIAREMWLVVSLVR